MLTAWCGGFSRAGLLFQVRQKYIQREITGSHEIVDTEYSQLAACSARISDRRHQHVTIVVFRQFVWNASRGRSPRKPAPDAWQTDLANCSANYLANYLASFDI
jgi:hypothetical protein